MKLLTLDLLAYGMFTNQLLDLSAGTEGVHLIYGPNEAGKSTILRAIVGLLYGIDRNTTDNFLHKNDQLRIGGRLRHCNGAELSCIRRKGTKNTLLSSDNTPFEESYLKTFLGGTPAELFTTVFGIDHEELVQGSAMMLQGKGALGEAMFAAALGGASLRKILAELDQCATELYLPRGHVRRLNQTLQAYESAKQQSKEATLLGKNYTQHANALRIAQKDLDAVLNRINTVTMEKARLERLQKALPLLAEREERQADLAELEKAGGKLDLPPDFSTQRIQTQQALHTALETVRQASDALAGLKERCKALMPPTALLEANETIDLLHQKLGEYRKGQVDKQKLNVQHTQLLGDAERLLKELNPDLELTGVGRLRPNLGRKVRIQNLITQYQALLAQQRQIAKEITQLTADCETARNVLEGMEEKRDLALLRATVRRAQQQGDLEAKLLALQATLQAKEFRGQTGLASLGLWRGSLDELERLPLPPVTCIDSVDTRLEELNQKIRSLDERLAVLEQDERDFTRQLTDLAVAGPVPTDEDLQRARQRREEGWGLIHQLWQEGRPITERIAAYTAGAPVASAYEQSVQQADEVADQLRREADRVAEYAHLSRGLGECQARQQEIRTERTAVEHLLQEARSAWIRLWEAAGITPWEPRDMRAWFERQTTLIELGKDIRETRQEIGHLTRLLAEHRESLSAALQQTGQPPAQPGESFGALLERAQDGITAIETANQRRVTQVARLQELDAKLKAADVTQQQTAAALQRWVTDWSEAIREWTFLSTDQPDEAHAILNALDEIFKKLDEAGGLEKRIQGINRDVAQFQVDVTQLAQLVASDLVTQPADSIVSILTKRLAQAKTDYATLTALMKQTVEKEKERDEAAKTAQSMEKQLATLCQSAGCQEPAELEAIERRASKAQQVRNALVTLEQRLLDLTGGQTIEALIHEVSSIEPDALVSQVENAGHELLELDKRRTALSDSVTRETVELERMNGTGTAAEWLEKAYGFFPQIRDEAVAYIKARLAVILLRIQIERYRREHQGPILARAGEIFALLTEGAYSALSTDFDEADKPILLGKKGSGEDVRVDAMSTGARDQLYLALRLASLEHYLSTNEPLPLILDDALVNFDDRRAQAALQVFADLSRRIQVIYFTHHAHVIELARASISGDMLFVHTLEAV